MEFEALKKAAAKVLGMDPDEINPNMTFRTDLDADSLDVYQIIINVEDELGIVIPTENLDKIITVREAVELIKEVRQNIKQ